MFLFKTLFTFVSMKTKKYTITNLDILKMHKRANRNTMPKIKPLISKDKKKDINKYLCRIKIK